MARRAALLLFALSSVFLLAGSAEAYTGAGPISEDIQNLFWAITVFAVVVATVVFGILIAFLIRYREGASPRPTSTLEGSKRLEILWTVVPAIILITILVITTPVLIYTDTIPTPDTTIRIVGSQFVWTFHYEDDTPSHPDASSPDLWIQAGIVVRIGVTSTDVVHSFYVPDVGVKIDAFPGHMNWWWMRADVPGDYLIQCAELCGVGHYGMRGVVHVFAAGTQPRIYGPPPKPPPVTVVQLRESGGNATKPWSIAPRNLTFSIGTLVDLWIWNNNSSPHDFRIDAPTDTIKPANATGTIPPFSNAWLNFTLNGTSPTPIPCGPTNASARTQGMVGALTIRAGTIIRVYLDDAGAGAGHAWQVEPSNLSIAKGANVTFEIHNIGSVPHNFTMLGRYANVKHDGLIQPGQVAYAGPYSFDEDASGTYQCSVPGHAASGMHAPYVVGAGGAAQVERGIPLFDMAWITILVCVPVTFAYVLHHARRRDDESST